MSPFELLAWMIVAWMAFMMVVALVIIGSAVVRGLRNRD